MRAIFITLVLFTASAFAQKPGFIVSHPDTIQSGDTLTISVTIKKIDITGFAKFEIFVPSGYIPVIKETFGAGVVFRENTLKLIWIELPADPSINMIIQFATDKRLYGNRDIYGNFYYLLKGQRAKEILPAQTTFLNNLQKTDIPESLLALYKKKYTLPSPGIVEADTLYRVQIGAYIKEVPNEILLEFYSKIENIKKEQQKGYFKYTVGNFSTQDEAALFRDNCGIRGAFIVKYVNGTRQ